MMKSGNKLILFALPASLAFWPMSYGIVLLNRLVPFRVIAPMILPLLFIMAVDLYYGEHFFSSMLSANWLAYLHLAPHEVRAAGRAKYFLATISFPIIGAIALIFIRGLLATEIAQGDALLFSLNTVVTNEPIFLTAITVYLIASLGLNISVQGHD